MEGRPIPWWQSSVMRSGLLAMILGLFQVYSAVTGTEIDVEVLRGVVDNGLGLIIGSLTLVAGWKAFVGRVKADAPIKKPTLPWLKGGNQAGR